MLNMVYYPHEHLETIVSTMKHLKKDAIVSLKNVFYIPTFINREKLPELLNQYQKNMKDFMCKNNLVLLTNSDILQF